MASEKCVQFSYRLLSNYNSAHILCLGPLPLISDIDHEKIQIRAARWIFLDYSGYSSIIWWHNLNDSHYREVAVRLIRIFYIILAL